MEKEYLIKGREPEAVFNFFEDISAIPRGSGNEAAVADYLCEFAKNHGLFCYRDGIDNVLIVKEASAGYENEAPILLQGHTDMVCEKNAATEHDFERDGLKLALDKNLLYAEGTTLGGDDGIAVAMMLAILASDSVKHPKIECLFTVQEETGLFGAYGFDYSKITAKKVINLDSEDEREAVAGCAGGVRTRFVHKFDTIPFANKGLKISITGLAGGHSGADINNCRANACRIMGRILAVLYAKHPFNLISLEGGNKDNAIPRECEAVIATADREGADEFIRTLYGEIKKEMSKDDRGLRVRMSKASGYEKMMTFKSTGRVLSAISLAPLGVLSVCPDNRSLVESSSNLGVIRTSSEQIELTFLSRSSVESVMDDICLRFERLASVCDFECTHHDRYPGWRYKKDTAMQRLYIKSAKKVFGSSFEPRVNAIHAGLECGIILSHLGEDADAVSIGPVMYDIHTPNERLDLDSCERVYKLLTAMLEDK